MSSGDEETSVNRAQGGGRSSSDVFSVSREEWKDFRRDVREGFTSIRQELSSINSQLGDGRLLHQKHQMQIEELAQNSAEQDRQISALNKVVRDLVIDKEAARPKSYGIVTSTLITTSVGLVCNAVLGVLLYQWAKAFAAGVHP